jgi:hypothetical protein
MSTHSNQARAIFLDAIEEPAPDRRAAFVEQAC